MLENSIAFESENRNIERRNCGKYHLDVVAAVRKKKKKNPVSSAHAYLREPSYIYTKQPNFRNY